MEQEGDRPVSSRECDFVGALAALHELIGGMARVSVRPTASPGTFLVSAGTLTRGYELGRSERSAVAFDVGETTFQVSPNTLMAAWREEYVGPDGSHRRLVAMELRCGTEIEVEELRADRDPDA
jgi:hypothetical protein